MHDINSSTTGPADRVGEAASVGAVAGGGRLAHQSLGAQQPMYGGARARCTTVGQVAAGADVSDHLAHRPGRMLGLDQEQQLGDLRLQPARTTAAARVLT